VGTLDYERAALPAACELLALAKDPDGVCGNEEDTVCSAIEPDIMDQFPDEGVRHAVVMGRFIGQGTCADLSTKTCTAMTITPEMLRIDQWRRSELHWADTSETIDFANGSISIAPPNYPQLQLDQTCDREHIAMRVNAKWIPQGQSAPVEPAADYLIPEGEWTPEGGSVKSVCVDINTPVGTPGYYALYLKVGDFPCKDVPGFSGVVDKFKRALYILGLVALICCVCCIIGIVLLCCRSDSHEESEEESDLDEEDES